MHLIAVIGSIFFGVSCFLLAVWHEYTWWKRRHWSKEQGTIVEFTENHDADGVNYHPKIEFSGADGLTQFISKYGSGRKPKIGKSVDLLIDEQRMSAEQFSFSNRLLFTIVPILFGTMFIFLGANVQPLEDAEQDSAHQSTTAL